MGVTQDVNICGIFSQKLALTAVLWFRVRRVRARGFLQAVMFFITRRKTAVPTSFKGKKSTSLNLE